MEEKIINELKEYLTSSPSKKLSIFKNNIDKFPFDETDENYKHNPILDITIYTLLVWNLDYIYAWFFSIKNLLKNTDILNVNKIIIMCDSITYPYVIEVAKLFKLPTLFEIHLHEGNISKVNFVVRENIHDINFIMQDCDFYTHNCRTFYENIFTYVNNSENNNTLLLFNDSFDIDTILYERLKNSYNGLIKTNDDVDKFINNLGVSFNEFKEFHKKWFNNTIVGFTKNTPILNKLIIDEFTRINSHCDESSWMLAAVKFNIKLITIEDVFNIPFNFYIGNVMKNNSFAFSICNDLEYISQLNDSYVEYILN